MIVPGCLLCVFEQLRKRLHLIPTQCLVVRLEELPHAGVIDGALCRVNRLAAGVRQDILDHGLLEEPVPLKLDRIESQQVLPFCARVLLPRFGVVKVPRAVLVATIFRLAAVAQQISFWTYGRSKHVMYPLPLPASAWMAQGCGLAVSAGSGSGSRSTRMVPSTGCGCLPGVDLAPALCCFGRAAFLRGGDLLASGMDSPSSADARNPDGALFFGLAAFFGVPTAGSGLETISSAVPSSPTSPSPSRSKPVLTSTKFTAPAKIDDLASPGPGSGSGSGSGCAYSSVHPLLISGVGGSLGTGESVDAGFAADAGPGGTLSCMGAGMGANARCYGVRTTDRPTVCVLCQRRVRAPQLRACATPGPQRRRDRAFRGSVAPTVTLSHTTTRSGRGAPYRPRRSRELARAQEPSPPPFSLTAGKECPAHGRSSRHARVPCVRFVQVLGHKKL